MVDIGQPEPPESRTPGDMLSKVRAQVTGPAVHSGILSLTDQGLVMAANFAASVMVARFCSETSYGAYVLMLSVLNLLTQVQGGLFGGPAAVIAPPLEGREFGRYVSGLMLVQLAAGFVASAAIALTGFIIWYVSQDSREFGLTLAALGAGAWAITSKALVRSVLYARLRAGGALAMDLAGAVAQVGLLAWLFMTGRMSAVTACLALGAGGIAGLVVGGVLSARYAVADFSGLRRVIAENWRIGKWMLATGLMLWLVVPALPWFLKATSGDEAVARWGAALNIVNISGPFLGGFAAIATPRFSAGYAQGGASELRRLVLKGTVVLVLGTFAFFALVALFGEEAARILYKGRYEGLGRLAAMLSGAQFVAVLGSSAAVGLVAMRRTDLQFFTYAAQAGVTLVAGWVLCAALGTSGAAAIFLIAGGVGGALRWIMFRRQTAQSG